MTTSQTSFGQLVIGPPGSGKTTYCHGVQQLLTHLNRKVAVINLDPGNDILPYECAVDIKELITVDDVMENLNLGPNAAFIYCMEFLETNLDWLREKLTSLSDNYLVIDCPGQTELFTHHKSLRNIVEILNQKWDIRLCAVHLVDSHYCNDPGTFISVVLTSLGAMLQVELPFVHVLSKVDLIEKDKRLIFNLDYYTEVLDLNCLWECLASDPFLQKYKKMTKIFAQFIEDYSLVAFTPLNIQDKENVYHILKQIDKCNGYILSSQEIPSRAAYLSSDNYDTSLIQENYMQPK